MSWSGGNPAFRAVIVGECSAFAEAVELAGGRVVAEVARGEPLVVDPDALLVVDWTREDGERVPDELLPWAERADIVCCSLDQLDAVAGALLLNDAQFLCEPSMTDRVLALAVASGLADRDNAPAVREGEAGRLSRFSAEVGRIAEALARLAAEAGGDAIADRRPGFDAGPGVDAADPQAIRQAIRARRLRDEYFPAGLFEDPAWDMLLDLFAAELEGARVSVSSLCIAAAVAPTTALRWIGRMSDAGLLVRVPDPQDRRRAFMALSDRARMGMRGYLAALSRAGLGMG